MPVSMRQIKRGKDKGKWVVVEPSGKRVGNPTTKARARERVFGRNLGEMTASERKRRGIAPRPRRRRRR